MKSTLKNQQLTRRQILTTALAGCAGLTLTGLSSLSWAQGASTVLLDVYKDPTCGCCANWIEHMQQNGFTSTVYHPRDLNGLKLEHGIRAELQSCHTAITAEGYAFEGHVPAKFIKQFLSSVPSNAKGLTAPGMPLGSPGMEMGGRFTPYDVILLNKDGSTRIYASIKSADQQF